MARQKSTLKDEITRMKLLPAQRKLASKRLDLVLRELDKRREQAEKLRYDLHTEEREADEARASLAETDTAANEEHEQ